MPAHLPVSAIWHAMRSDGKAISPVDWRANRLVDALAKAAAATRQTPNEARVLIKSALSTLRFAGLRLGLVTYWANNREDVSSHTVLRRDAASKNHDRVSRAEGGKRTLQTEECSRVSRASPSTDAQATGKPVQQSERPEVAGVDDLPSTRHLATGAIKRKRDAPDKFADPNSLNGKRRRATLKGEAIATCREQAAMQRCAVSLHAPCSSDAVASASQPTAAQRLDALGARVRAKAACNGA